MSCLFYLLIMQKSLIPLIDFLHQPLIGIDGTETILTGMTTAILSRLLLLLLLLLKLRVKMRHGVVNDVLVQIHEDKVNIEIDDGDEKNGPKPTGGQI